MAQSSNPIPKILDLIPAQGTVLSLLLAEEMRMVICNCTQSIVSNGYIMMLLSHLNDNSLISVEELTWPNVAGNIFIIRKNSHGPQF